MVRVKICGTTCVEDAMTAVRAGADALGFVFWRGSPRYIDPVRAAAIIAALPPFISTVGVFVNAEPVEIKRIAARTGVSFVQLHGDEKPKTIDALRGLRVIKALRIACEGDLGRLILYQVEAFLLDAYVKGQPGGTGTTFDWDLARRATLSGTVILAGGLTPENVAAAVRKARPFAVDVASGVEDAPGEKNKKLIFEFVRNAKSVEL